MFIFLINNFAGNGETRLWKFLWWLVEDEEDRVAPLTSARKTYDKFFASDGTEEDEQKPSNFNAFGQDTFGRGQAVSSVQYSLVSTGWYPKPMHCWRLLGGGKQKKIGPKAQESQNGNCFLKTREI